MKKVILSLIVCLLMFSLAACSNTPQNEENSNVDESNNQDIILDNSTNENSEIVSGENEDNIESENIDYKTSYKAKLEELLLEDESIEYVLYNIDEDEIPEMFVVIGEVEATKKINIYDIIDGNIHETNVAEFGGHTNLVGAIDINTVIFQYANKDYEIVSVLHYNEDGTYTLEQIKETTVDPTLGYIPFEPLKTFAATDASGLEWQENADDENYWYINAGNSES